MGLAKLPEDIAKQAEDRARQCDDMSSDLKALMAAPKSKMAASRSKRKKVKRIKVKETEVKRGDPKSKFGTLSPKAFTFIKEELRNRDLKIGHLKERIVSLENEKAQLAAELDFYKVKYHDVIGRRTLSRKSSDA